ncbi:MAG TPA: AAA family ATPase [Phycisphaerae bacterium]|nr:AAA family ATPase [Phycisphaerae bacterium]
MEMPSQNEKARGPMERLIRGRHPCIVATASEEEFALTLVREIVMRTPVTFNVWSINGGLRDGLLVDHPPIPETEHPAGALYYLLQQSASTLTVFLDLAPHLRDERTLRLMRDLIEHGRRTGSQLILIDHRDELPAIIESMSARFEIGLPDDEEIELIVRGVLRAGNEHERIQADIGRRAFHSILQNLRGLTRRQVSQIILETIAEDRRFDADDLHTVLARKRQIIQGRGLLEFVEAPQDLSEVGGLKNLKRWLEVRRHVFSDEAIKFGLVAPRGILLLGVQGAGKSYCAKAIATAWQRPLLRMEVGALYDRFIGESERHLRDAFLQAEMMAPIVLWIDEIEKAFASAASRNVDGGLSQRMFGALLTWMQEHRAPVFLVATANDLEALPPELLRKGRFDEIFFVDLPGTATREEIFTVHLKRRKRDPGKFDLRLLGERSNGYTGAEIEQAIISALYEAFAAGEDIDTDRLIASLAGSPPLSVIQPERVQALRDWAVGRCVVAE